MATRRAPPFDRVARSDRGREASAGVEPKTGSEGASATLRVRARKGAPKIGIPNGCLFAAAALAPLPFGTVDPVSIAVFCCVLSAGLIFVSPTRVHGLRTWVLVWMFFLTIAYGFVLHEQVSTTPWIAKFDPVWERASSALGVRLQGSVSVIRNAPLFALGNTIACILSVCLGLVVGSERQDARRLLWVVACSGAGYAAYGIFSALVTPNEILWLDRPGYNGYVTGTFVNRNTAATYFGSISVIWLLLLLESLRAKLPRSKRSVKRLARHLFKALNKHEILMSSGLCVSVMALLMTGSRGGVVFSLIGMILAGAVTLRAALPEKYGVHWLWIGGAILVLIFLQIFGGVVEKRFEQSGLSDEGRFDAYGWMLRAIADRPVFGSGLGTFETIFPTYRQVPPSMQGVWTLGHCTPLEMAVELGIPLTALVVISVVLGFAILVRGAFARRQDEILPLAGAVVLGVGACHSCIDFSLQIPGFAIVVMMVTGAGLAQATRSRIPRHDGPSVQGDLVKDRQTYRAVRPA